MRYEILGPVRLTGRNETTSISAAKIETLLVVLLIRAGHVVTSDQLIAEIWRDNVPSRVIAGLHVYVSKLRKFMQRSDSTIVTHPSGYELRMGSDELDVHAFSDHVHRGRNHLRRHDHERAVESLGAALELVRGPMHQHVRNGPIVEGFTAWLEEARLECVEMLIEAKLALGHHRQLIGELYPLTAAHPLREAFYRQLMLALYRSDRQANALQVYQHARRTLDDELGVAPCRALQDLHQAILQVDDRLLLVG